MGRAVGILLTNFVLSIFVLGALSLASGQNFLLIGPLMVLTVLLSLAQHYLH